MFHGDHIDVFHGRDFEPKWGTEIEPNRRTEPNRTESPLKGGDFGTAGIRFSPISVRFLGPVDNPASEQHR